MGASARLLILLAPLACADPEASAEKQLQPEVVVDAWLSKVKDLNHSYDAAWKKWERLPVVPGHDLVVREWAECGLDQLFFDVEREFRSWLTVEAAANVEPIRLLGTSRGQYGETWEVIWDLVWMPRMEIWEVSRLRRKSRLLRRYREGEDLWAVVAVAWVDDAQGFVERAEHVLEFRLRWIGDRWRLDSVPRAAPSEPSFDLRFDGERWGVTPQREAGWVIAGRAGSKTSTTVPVQRSDLALSPHLAQSTSRHFAHGLVMRTRADWSVQ